VTVCQSKSEGGRRCAAHSPRPRLLPTEAAAARSQTVVDIPDMPAWYEPERGRVHRFLVPTLTDDDRRLFWYREQGYRGALDRHGWPVLGDDQ
jgi:hypothetical protein